MFVVFVFVQIFNFCMYGINSGLYFVTYRVTTLLGKSWIFFLKFPGPTWKVLKNEFGSGESWKFKFKVLESPVNHLCFKLTNMLCMYTCRTTCVNNVRIIPATLLTEQLFSMHLTLLERALAVAFLSVCPSNVCFVTKQNHLSVCQHHMIEGFFQFPESQISWCWV